MVNKFRGTGGTTVFVTDGGHRRLVAGSQKRAPRPGRGADRRLGDELIDVLTTYEDHVLPLAPSERPCAATSLLNFPGRADSGKLSEDGRRTGEVLRAGSRRLYVRPDLRSLLERITAYGLVLDHQVVTTRPAGTAVHVRDTSDRRGDKGRPLSDAVNTAIILATGPLPDGPLADLGRQVIKQRTAQFFWDAAVRQLSTHLPEGAQLYLTRPVLSEIRYVLSDALPKLLLNDDEWMEKLEQVLPTWQGPLTALAQELPMLVDRGKRTATGESQR